MELAIDPDQWTKEECDAVQNYLERHMSVFRRCVCKEGNFHNVILDSYPKAAWKYMKRQLALFAGKEECFRNVVYFSGAVAGIELVLSRMR